MERFDISGSWRIAAAGAILGAALGWPGARGGVPSPPAGTERVVVASVTDGDTLLLDDGRRVRILGIDAPETVHPGLSGPQAFGRQASRRLTQLVQARVIGLERDRSEVDAYGRLLRHVWLGQDLVAAILLREGLAWPLGIPPDLGHAEDLAAAGATARAAGLGIWGIARPTPLAVFRRPPALGVPGLRP
jgi:endonuclease YncB( thermonuclease family)